MLKVSILNRLYFFVLFLGKPKINKKTTMKYDLFFRMIVNNNNNK